jgi:hypothetical protein
MPYLTPHIQHSNLGLPLRDVEGLVGELPEADLLVAPVAEHDDGAAPAQRGLGDGGEVGSRHPAHEVLQMAGMHAATLTVPRQPHLQLSTMCSVISAFKMDMQKKTSMTLIFERWTKELERKV